MMSRYRPPGRHDQRGAAALMAAVFLILVVSILGLITLRLAATSVNDSLLNHDGVAALFLAETGLERAAGQLAAGTVTCGAGLAGSWTLAGGTISIANLGAGFTTDFAGAALPSGQCRVQATGTTGLFTAQRSIEAIIATSGGNLLGSANANFNAPNTPCPPSTCTPTGWVLSLWDDTGGVDGTRAAYVEKPTPGPSDVTSAGQFSMTPFTVTAPATLTMSFDYKLVSAVIAGGQTMQLAMRLFSGATPYLGTPNPFSRPHTGVFQNGTITFSIPGTGPVTIDGFDFTLTAKSGSAKWAWLDNLVLTSSGGGSSTASVIRWRERIQ